MMTLISRTYWAGMPFRFRSPPAGAGCESRVLRTEDFRELRALYWTPKGCPRPKLVLIALHPRVDFSHHYTFPGLLAAGIGCLGATSRHHGDPAAVVHEELVLDLAACIRWLREHRAVERVVLLGNSGGGPLAGLYQAQARRPAEHRLQHTPGGSPTLLAAAQLPPADGLVLLAAHRGPGQVLEAAIDGAVVDENDPSHSDTSLDMYLPANGFLPAPQWSTYSADFVARYRAAQRARVLRLDALARSWLTRAHEAEAGTGSDPELALRRARQRAFQPVMVIYRTMANLSYVARHLDPSPRDYGSLLSERPDLMNWRYLGFARTCTAEAWLSTWSAPSSQADLVATLAHIPDPTLVVHAGRDREIFPSDQRAISEAVVAADRQLEVFADARHYFEAEPGSREGPERQALGELLVQWLRARFA